MKLSAFRKQSVGPLTLNPGKNVVLFFYPADATCVFPAPTRVLRFAR